MAVNGKIQNSNLSYYFTEYCDNSTIHGLKFLGERQRSWIEKIWWIFFVSLSLYLCTTLILSTYYKWMTSPVIVSFATSETPISEVPFPAVTICPLMKTDLNKFNFNEVSSVNYTSGEAANLTHLSLICPRILELFPDIQDMEYVNGDAIDFLIDILPDFDASIRDCKFCGDDCHLSTRNIFTPVLTSNAICYSFNVLDWLDVFRNGTDLNYYNGLEIEHQLRSTWNTEDGYLGDSQMYPRRTATTGTNGGLELTLTQLIQDASYNCGNTLKGFKIMIHHPGEMARFHQHYFWLPLDQLVSVSVKPNMITTHENLRDYKPKHRWCYFQDEISLKYFKIYNQQNCVLECVTNFTLVRCGCVSFYMPRTSDIPLCGPAKFQCAEDANNDFNKIKVRTQKLGSKSSKTNLEDSNGCNCMPACYSLHYDTETSQLDWDWQNLNLLNTSEYVSENETIHLSILRIFFKDMQFMTSERNELYGQTDFWANCGGLVGLFTGFSVISFIEIVYYCTLRFFCNVKKYGWQRWSGSEELAKLSDDSNLNK